MLAAQERETPRNHCAGVPCAQIKAVCFRTDMQASVRVSGGTLLSNFKANESVRKPTENVGSGSGNQGTCFLVIWSL